MKWILISESIDIDQVKTYDQLIRWANSTYDELYNNGYSDWEACSEIAETLVKNGYGDEKFWSEKLRAGSIMDDGHYSRLRDLISGDIKKNYPRLNNLKKGSKDDGGENVRKPKPSKVSKPKPMVRKPKQKVEPDDGELRMPEIQADTILCGTYKGPVTFSSFTWYKVTRRIGTSVLKVVELRQIPGYDREFGLSFVMASKKRKDTRTYTLIIDKDGKIHQKGEETDKTFQVWDGEPKYFRIGRGR